MRQAEIIAENSPDAQRKVGSVLVKKDGGEVIAQGYNGFVRNARDEVLPNTRPDKYEYIIHSEQNLLFNCCRNGISTKDCFLVCTLSPCITCLRSLYQSGVKEIYFKDKYKDFDKQLNMLDLEINLTKEGDYFKILLNTK
jgi:dCMP deaminase